MLVLWEGYTITTGREEAGVDIRLRGRGPPHGVDFRSVLISCGKPCADGALQNGVGAIHDFIQRSGPREQRLRLAQQILAAGHVWRREETQNLGGAILCPIQCVAERRQLVSLQRCGDIGRNALRIETRRELFRYTIDDPRPSRCSLRSTGTGGSFSPGLGRPTTWPSGHNTPRRIPTI